MTKQYDVVGVCNALVDVLIQVSDEEFAALEIEKGVMHLVDGDRQAAVLDRFTEKPTTTELGGSAMNAIRTLAELGHATVFAGMISDDAFGHQIRTRMDELKIKACLGMSHEPTGSCIILVTPDGERTMNTNLGASRLYTTEQIPHSEIAGAKILHFCGYQWDTDGQKSAIKEAIQTARENGTQVSFDVADPFVVSRFRDEFDQVIKDGADVVFANREEAKLLYNSTPQDAAKRIADTGAIAVMKLGADGALVRQGDQEFHIDPVKTNVVDTTAAGDMFAAGFLAGLARGKDLPTCGLMAATMASDVISRMGATVSNAALGKVGAM